MLRYGVISQVDPAKGVAKVSFEADDGLESYWLQVMHGRTFQDRHYCMPDPGEHVACLMDENDENGVILGAIYSKADRPPKRGSDKAVRWDFRDGTFLEYDPENSELKIDALGKVKISVLGDCEISSTSGVSLSAGTDLKIQAWDTLTVGVSGPATIKCADTATVYGNILNLTSETVANLTAEKVINCQAPTINATATTINATTSGAANITASTAINLTAPTVNVIGEFSVAGNITCTGTNPAHHEHPVVQHSVAIAVYP